MRRSRGDATARRPSGRRLAGLIGVLPALALLVACATSVPVTPRSHVPEPEAPYLLDPLRGFPLAADPELEREVRQGYGVVRRGGDLVALEASLEDLLERRPGFHPAAVLLAQIAYLADDLTAARELLEPVADELPGYTACQLLLGRVAELGDELPLALAAFRRAAPGSAVARGRVAALEPRVLEILLHRIHDLVDRGHLEEAERQLAEIESWAGEPLPVLEARRALALAAGDVEAERDILRRLVAEGGGGDELIERLADLDILSGDLASGLRQLERLAERRGDDAALAEKVERAKFLWRLQLLPPYVQDVASESVLDRADFATLLYWLVPSVRYAEVADPPIATDILEHPRREEILRVMNLALVPVDETLHRFSPDEEATRALALGALLGLLQLADAEVACLAEPESRALRRSWSLTCRKAAQCRLIPEEADCLPQASISGPDALDLFRRALDLLGSQ